MSIPWLTKKNKDGTVARDAQGKPIRYQILPKGNRQNLPKSLQTVSLSEIPEAIRRQQAKRRAKKNPDELEDEAMIEQAIAEEEMERIEKERKKNVVTKLNLMVDKELKKQELKKALEVAKSDQAEEEAAKKDWESSVGNDVMG